MNQARSVFLIGPMGAGKTTVGRLLARKLGRPFFDSDHEIENAANASVSWIFDVEGESGFRSRESRMIASLAERSGIVLATGGGAVLDASNRALLKERGIVVYLHVPLEQQLARTSKGGNRPLLETPDRAERIRELFEARHPIYSELADITVEARGRHAQIVCKAVCRELERHLSLQAATG